MLSIAIGTIHLPVGGWRSITVAGWAHFGRLEEGLIDAIGRQGVSGIPSQKYLSLQ